MVPVILTHEVSIRASGGIVRPCTCHHAFLPLGEMTQDMIDMVMASPQLLLTNPTMWEEMELPDGPNTQYPEMICQLHQSPRELRIAQAPLN